jgi:hypothetical protein
MSIIITAGVQGPEGPPGATGAGATGATGVAGPTGAAGEPRPQNELVRATRTHRVVCRALAIRKR